MRSSPTQKNFLSPFQGVRSPQRTRVSQWILRFVNLCLHRPSRLLSHCYVSCSSRMSSISRRACIAHGEILHVSGATMLTVSLLSLTFCISRPHPHPMLPHRMRSQMIPEAMSPRILFTYSSRKLLRIICQLAISVLPHFRPMIHRLNTGRRHHLHRTSTHPYSWYLLPPKKTSS